MGCFKTCLKEKVDGWVIKIKSIRVAIGKYGRVCEGG